MYISNLLKEEPEDIKHHIRKIKEHNPYGFQILLHYLARDGKLLINASEELKDNYSAVKTAVIQNGESLAYASYRLRGHKELALLALEKDGLNYRYLTEDLQYDDELILKAVQTTPKALRFVPAELQNSLELLRLLQGAQIPNIPVFKNWYKEKMVILEILENEHWMENNISQVSTSITRPKKF